MRQNMKISLSSVFDSLLNASVVLFSHAAFFVELVNPLDALVELIWVLQEFLGRLRVLFGGELVL